MFPKYWTQLEAKEIEKINLFYYSKNIQNLLGSSDVQLRYPLLKARMPQCMDDDLQYVSFFLVPCQSVMPNIKNNFNFYKLQKIEEKTITIRKTISFFMASLIGNWFFLDEKICKRSNKFSMSSDHPNSAIPLYNSRSFSPYGRQLSTKANELQLANNVRIIFEFQINLKAKLN